MKMTKKVMAKKRRQDVVEEDAKKSESAPIVTILADKKGLTKIR